MNSLCIVASADQRKPIFYPEIYDEKRYLEKQQEFLEKNPSLCGLDYHHPREKFFPHKHLADGSCSLVPAKLGEYNWPACRIRMCILIYAHPEGLTLEQLMSLLGITEKSAIRHLTALNTCQFIFIGYLPSTAEA